MVNMINPKEEQALTIAIAIVRGHLLSDTNGLDHPERDVSPLSEEFHIVVAVMLRDGRYGAQVEARAWKCGSEHKRRQNLSLHG